LKSLIEIEISTGEINGECSRKYQYEIQVFWDDKKMETLGRTQVYKCPNFQVYANLFLTLQGFCVMKNNSSTINHSAKSH